MADTIFKVPTLQLLKKRITSLDDMYAYIDKLPDKQDAREELYEYMLSKLFITGINGQFRTPQQVISTLVKFLDLQSKDTICDPACGTYCFFVSTREHLKENYIRKIFYNKKAKIHYDNDLFTGYDMENEGHNLDDKRNYIEVSNIPDMKHFFIGQGKDNQAY